MKSYDWHYTPDADDIAKSRGIPCPCSGGESFKTESQAIWHGRQWQRETGRTGTITAIPAEPKMTCSYIADY